MTALGRDRVHPVLRACLNAHTHVGIGDRMSGAERKAMVSGWHTLRVAHAVSMALWAEPAGSYFLLRDNLSSHW